MGVISVPNPYYTPYAFYRKSIIWRVLKNELGIALWEII